MSIPIGYLLFGNKGENLVMEPNERRKHRRTRLGELIDWKFRGSQAMFAAAAQIPATLVSRYLGGQKGIGEDMRNKIETNLNLAGWFDAPVGTNGAEQPLVKRVLFTANEAENRGRVTARHPDDPLGEDDVLVPEYRVSFSAGPGSAPEYEIVEEAEPAIYKISWFRKERINPKNAKRFKVRHDSMVPLLYPGDTILVNLAENSMANVIDGKVYAIRYGNELRVKKLQVLLGGTLVLKSENPAYNDETLTPEMVAEYITIIGRVRDKSGSGGL